MAFRKTLAQRLSSSISRTPTLTSCRISSPPSFKTLAQQAPATGAPPDPGDAAFSRRFVQRSSIFHSASWPEIMSPAIGESVRERLREMDIGKDRLRLDGLSPPATAGGVTVEDARKLLKVSQLEIVKSRLGEIQRSWIAYSEFVQICTESCSSNEQGLEFAKMLDEWGSVIVLGSVVLLRPHQVVKALEGLIGAPSAATTTAAAAAIHREDPRRKELEEMEKQKAIIDEKAESMVRRELWAGLGFFVVQTLGFMRLTFWELSWDVMEPICFYVTSAYCMAGYAFFMRTATEPSFEGFFRSRLGANQNRLMKARNFDMKKYFELREACESHSPPSPLDCTPASSNREMKFTHHYS